MGGTSRSNTVIRQVSNTDLVADPQGDKDDVKAVRRSSHRISRHASQRDREGPRESTRRHRHHSPRPEDVGRHHSHHHHRHETHHHHHRHEHHQRSDSYMSGASVEASSPRKSKVPVMADDGYHTSSSHRRHRTPGEQATHEARKEARRLAREEVVEHGPQLASPRSAYHRQRTLEEKMAHDVRKEAHRLARETMAEDGHHNSTNAYRRQRTLEEKMAHDERKEARRLAREKERERERELEIALDKVRKKEEEKAREQQEKRRHREREREREWEREREKLRELGKGHDRERVKEGGDPDGAKEVEKDKENEKERRLKEIERAREREKQRDMVSASASTSPRHHKSSEAVTSAVKTTEASSPSKSRRGEDFSSSARWSTDVGRPRHRHRTSALAMSKTASSTEASSIPVPAKVTPAAHERAREREVDEPWHHDPRRTGRLVIRPCRASDADPLMAAAATAGSSKNFFSIKDGKSIVESNFAPRVSTDKPAHVRRSTTARSIKLDMHAATASDESRDGFDRPVKDKDKLDREHERDRRAERTEWADDARDISDHADQASRNQDSPHTSPCKGECERHRDRRLEKRERGRHYRSDDEKKPSLRATFKKWIKR